jgi:hypothetical protein
MEVQGQEYLEFLSKIDGGKLMEDFIASLRSGIRDPNDILHTMDVTEVLPQKWLESKVQRIRRFAVETN